MQAKILRVRQEGEITRLGGWQPIKVDVRLISATNRNLTRMVEEGKFRQDLYFRLNVVNIMIPSLHERIGDIPLLCEHVLSRLNRKLGRHVEGVEEQAMDRWFLCKKFLSWLMDEKFDWVTKAKRNTVLFRKIYDPVLGKELYIKLNSKQLLREVYPRVRALGKGSVLSIPMAYAKK